MAFPISAANVAVLNAAETVPVHQVKTFWGESNATFVVLLGSPVPAAMQLEFGVNWVVWVVLVAERVLLAADAFLAAINGFSMLLRGQIHHAVNWDEPSA